MIELTQEESEKQAVILKRIQTEVINLDTEYLKRALEGMKKHLSFRASAMILNPNPFTASAQADLESLKLKQLDLYIKLADNIGEIAAAEGRLIMGRQNTNRLEDLFR